MIPLEELDRLREIKKKYEQLKEDVANKAPIVLKVIERRSPLRDAINFWCTQKRLQPPVVPPLNIAYALTDRDQEFAKLIDQLNHANERFKVLREARIPAGIHLKSRKVEDVIMML